MRSLFGVATLAVVAMMFKDAVAKGSQAPKLATNVGSEVVDFYKTL